MDEDWMMKPVDEMTEAEAKAGLKLLLSKIEELDKVMKEVQPILDRIYAQW